MRKTILLILTFSTSVHANTIGWISGQAGPDGWTINPINPTSSQVISFSGPTGVYSNSCVGEVALGGKPTLLVDTLNKVVELRIIGPAPLACILIYAPVCGLQGQFGPLSPGRWVFRSSSPHIGLEIPFTVGPTKVIYVDKDSPTPSGDGTSWSKAYRRLEDGLAAAWSGDVVRVAEGTYRPSTYDRLASFAIPAGVTVLGGYPGYGQPNPNARDTKTYATILSGDLNGDDLWDILHRKENSYHVVRAAGSFPPAVLDGLTITAGQADGPYPHHTGGGVLVDGGNLWLKGCTIKGNTAIFGAGLACLAGRVLAGNCQISGNRGLLLGGGLYQQSGSIEMINCLITGNTASAAGSLGGSAIFNIMGQLTIHSSTIADNPAPNGRAIAGYLIDKEAGGNLDVANSIIYNGPTEFGFSNTTLVSVNYSDVKGGWPGTGNITSDPKFVNPGEFSIHGQWIDGDYRLKSDSPCINRGDKTILPMDVLDLDGDGNDNEPVGVDLDGNNRVQSTQVDIGAYESAGSGSGDGGGWGWMPVATIDVLYDVPINPPGSPITVSGGPYHNTINLNFKAELALQASSASAADGTWSAWFDPDPNPVGPGTVDVTYYVQGLNVELWRLPPGTPNYKIATITFYVRPAP
ncbi:MAG: choice-of-anchor Q domain-containing protein [Sedimentisphaerales bacterium]|jgi:hypothetical protein|nr:choice-of-anchor Q domain-containing protein [Sedimentisphaerales bacterium]